MWNLRVNTKKTKKGRHTTYNFIYGNVVLDIVTSFEYLRMYVFKNGNLYRTEQKLTQHSYPVNRATIAACRKILFDTGPRPLS